jgi:hypothetical protein
MTLAGFLLWSGKEVEVQAALAKICKLTRQNIELLPSQIRYLKYLQDVHDNGPPKLRKIRVRRVILDGIPRIEKEGTAVRPYLQVFKNSQLIFNSHSQEYPPVSYDIEDLSIVFDMELELQDDVFVRCRHLGRNGQGVTIFRLMFHTSFIQSDVIRFTKSTLDGANNDNRFPDTFRVDFICDLNEISSNDCLDPKSLISGDHNKPEEIKLDKDDSDQEMDEYFKELENK